MELSVDDLSPRERVVFVASCQLEGSAPNGRLPVMLDPDYAEACERLRELGWLERVEVEGKLVGYRLTKAARTAHHMRALIERAKGAVN